MSSKEIKLGDMLELSDVALVLVKNKGSEEEPGLSLTDSVMRGGLSMVGMLNGDSVIAPVEIDVAFDTDGDRELVRHVTLRVGWNAKKWDRKKYEEVAAQARETD